MTLGSYKKCQEIFMKHLFKLSIFSLLMFLPELQIDALDNNNLTAQTILENITLTPDQLEELQKTVKQKNEIVKSLYAKYNSDSFPIYDSCRKVLLTGKDNGWIKQNKDTCKDLQNAYFKAFEQSLAAQENCSFLASGKNIIVSANNTHKIIKIIHGDDTITSLIKSQKGCSKQNAPHGRLLGSENFPSTDDFGCQVFKEILQLCINNPSIAQWHRSKKL